MNKTPSLHKNRQFYRDQIHKTTGSKFDYNNCVDFVINNEGNMSIIGSRFECPIKYECVILKKTDFYQIQTNSETPKLIKQAYKSYPCSFSANAAVVAGCVTFYVIRTFIFEARYEEYLKLGFFESIKRTPIVRSLLIIYCAALCLMPQIVGMSRIEDHRNDVYGVVLGILVGFFVAGIVNLVYFSEVYFKWYMEQSSYYESTDSSLSDNSCSLANSYPSGKINVIKIQTSTDDSIFDDSLMATVSNYKSGNFDRRLHEGAVQVITRREIPV